MQKHYTISKDSKELGPYTLAQVLEAISASKIAVTDYIYIDDKQDWISLLEFQPAVDHLKANKPKTAPKTIIKTEESEIPSHIETINQDSEEWFLLRENKKLGPFQYVDVIKMLQENQAYEFDFVWNGNMAKWTRIAELREFSPERMKNMMQEQKALFAKRSHKRADYRSEIMVTDSSEIYHGSYLQISEGGAKIKVGHSMLSPGDRIIVHHKSSEELPPFNAACEITNKSYSQLIKNKKQEVEYIVKFLQLNDMAIKSIRDYTKKIA
jgi:hypothetical protein